jgi:hypothetical protein
MPSRAITRQVADKISSRRASQSTIFGISPQRLPYQQLPVPADPPRTSRSAYHTSRS